VGTAWSISPDAALVDLVHTQWEAKDGAPPGGADSIAQTADGLLWLAGHANPGLYRFDGRRFDYMELPRIDGSNPGSIYKLFAPKTGGLWIGFTFGGAAFLLDGRSTFYTEKDGLPPGSVKGFAEASDGTLWAATTHGVARLVENHWHLVSQLDTVGADPAAITFDTEGTLWLPCVDRMLFWPKDATGFQTLAGFSFSQGSAMMESASGVIWVTDDNGLHQLKKISNRENVTVSAVMPGLLIDRQGSIWVNDPTRGIGRLANPEEAPASATIAWTDPRWVFLLNHGFPLQFC
jgi:ligand-binding sensor domain-containing protein